LNTAGLLREARADHVRISVDDNSQVVVRGRKLAMERWLPTLRSHREEVRAWLAAESLIRAAMRACDYWGDDDMTREQMVRDCLETPPERRDALQAHFERTYPAPDTSGGNQE
jgi:hypothetical protein